MSSWQSGDTSRSGSRRKTDPAVPYVVIPPYAVSTPTTTGQTHTRSTPRSSWSPHRAPNRPVSWQHGYSTAQEQSGGAHYREQDAIWHRGNLPAQTQVERHRSLQASKQMLYNVYAQNIGMLEKLEDLEDGGSKTAGHVHSTGSAFRNSTSNVRRQSSTSHVSQNRGQAAGRAVRALGKSDVPLPDQSHKTERDLKAIMDAELTCLQAQLTFCPPEVRDQTRDELVQKTLGWVAEREEKGAREGMVDKYASKVVETLLTGQTSHDPRPLTPGREAVLAGVRALQIGQHHGAEQDRKFYEDPARQARCPRIRSGERPYVTGAKRVLDVHPNLGPHLSGQYYSGSQR